MTQKTLCHDALATRNSQFNRKKLNTAQPRTLQLFIFFLSKTATQNTVKVTVTPIITGMG